MSPSNGSILFGKETIRFKLFFVDRKTLEIAVHPDKTVIVKAPLRINLTAVEEKVRKRAGWIKRQLDFFRQYDPRTPGRNYVGGETHLYLGRQYRLKIRQSVLNEVKLFRGYFQVSAKADTSPEHIKRLMDTWYRNKALLRFQESFDRCWPCFEKELWKKPRVKIRSMKMRWGSLSNNDLLTLNINLIKAPKECIDYVITHELCHLHYHDHGANFYRLIETVMPDWEKRKAKLELALV